MILLRRLIGDVLRARRQGQRRTLREVSSAANVSLGYLSEIERGQKEPSSELLAAICDALGARLSEVLREVCDTVAVAEKLPSVLAPVSEGPVRRAVPQQAGAAPRAEEAPVRAALGEPAVRRSSDGPVHQVTTDGTVSVSVRQESPFKATLRTTRRIRSAEPGRDVVRAA
jgi:transcriptional regulator with XRE-family HTH domain